MKLEKRKQFIINFLYFAIILGIVILLARYALGVLTPFLIALLVSAAQARGRLFTKRLSRRAA